MQKILIYLLLVLTTYYSYSQPRKNLLSQTDKDFLSFFEVFKETIRNNDKFAMAEMINFPFIFLSCEIIYWNKYQFVNNITNSDIEYFPPKNNLMNYLRNNLKYFDKVIDFEKKLVFKKNNPYLRIWIEIERRKIMDEDKKFCIPDSDLSYFYEVRISYEFDDSESGDFLRFFKINNRFKLVHFGITG